MTSSVLIIDDESILRKMLKKMLEAHPDFSIFGEAASANEAMALMENAQPDLILLDVGLPHISGLDLIRRLDSPPSVVFVSASGSHAVAAFELEALDYLVKPVSEERLAATLDRFRTFKAIKRSQPSDYILITTPNGVIKKVHSYQIIYLKAEGNYSQIRLIDGTSILIHKSLGTLEDQLTPSFLKVDRSLLVNLTHVDEISVSDRDSGLLSFKTDIEPIKLGRTALVRLKQALKDL